MKPLVKNLWDLFNKYTLINIIRAITYPFTSIMFIPYRWIEVLSSLTIIKTVKREFLAFSTRQYINRLFYDTMALLFTRFGVKGKCNYYGTGKYHLSRWFTHSPIALIFTWKTKPFGIPLAMAIWLGSFFVWGLHISWSWLLLVWGFIAISTFYYYQVLRGVNYNALGWMFLPLGLMGLFTHNHLLTSICLLGASFSSITAAFFFGFLILVMVLQIGEPALLIAFMPTILFLSARMIFSIEKEKIGQYIKNTLQAIGAMPIQAKYKRTSKKRFNLTFIYFLLLYGQYLLVARLVTGQCDLLMISILILYMINYTFIRFADPQSFYMVMMSLLGTHAITHNQIWLLPSLWIFLSPIPVSLFGASDIRLDYVPHYTLTSMQPLYENMRNFFDEVKSGQRVLMTLNNPDGIYEKIFDGYRVLYELPNYVLTEKKVFMLPTWWTIFELNYEGAPEIWGKDVNTALMNARYWKADFIVHYQENKDKLEPQWEKNGFKLCNQFNWQDFEPVLRGERISEKPLPTWFLLKVP